MLECDHAALSDQGTVRDNNEDYVTAYSPTDPAEGTRKGCLFVIADGVGGSKAGEVASSVGTQALVAAYYTSGKGPEKALREAFSAANLHVADMSHTNPAYRSMETTLSALALVGDSAVIAHIGDSRIYRVRAGAITQLTGDHSEVGELVRMRLITAEEARHHPRRNIITRSLGSDVLVQGDFKTEGVEVGDIFVLCTDGLWEPVEDAEIAAVVAEATPADACRRLIELAIARGTADNLSIQVIKVLKLGEPLPGSRGRSNGLLHRTLRLLGAKENEPA